ncbi:hypothetical protein [Armatimonas sp.]|uniref:hypothetical protein n=1 Tax=Armatimonas sp. TaxID=1872638 RepID=UPI00286A1EAF|nr:hypothetical protein [Armatimonas sp.]
MQEIEEALAALIGAQLTDMWCYAGRQVLEFGEQVPFVNKKGKHVSRAPASLILSCDWQLWDGVEIILSSSDFIPERRDGDADGFYGFIATAPPQVETVVVLEQGALRLLLSSGHTLEVNPTAWNSPHQAFLPGEQWRFIADTMPDEQLVITSTGYEFIDCESFTPLVARGMQSRKPETSTT